MAKAVGLRGWLPRRSNRGVAGARCQQDQRSGSPVCVPLTRPSFLEDIRE